MKLKAFLSQTTGSNTNFCIDNYDLLQTVEVWVRTVLDVYHGLYGSLDISLQEFLICECFLLDIRN